MEELLGGWRSAGRIRRRSEDVGARSKGVIDSRHFYGKEDTRMDINTSVYIVLGSRQKTNGMHLWKWQTYIPT